MANDNYYDDATVAGWSLNGTGWNAMADEIDKVRLGTLTASLISDFDTEVSNNSSVTANTAKISFDSTSSTKLSGIATGAEVNTIDSDPSGVSGADQVTNVMSLTTAEYGAIGTPDAATLYIITDA